MVVLKSSTVIFLLVLYLDPSLAQSRNLLRPSNKDCPEGKGYAWVSCLLFDVRCDNNNCQRYKDTELINNITCKKKTTPCGTCIPAYYLNDKEIDCDAPAGYVEDCPPDKKLVECNLNPCLSTTCNADMFSVAECRPRKCGGCLTEYYVNGTWQRCPVSIVEIQPDAMIVRSMHPGGMAHRQAAPPVVEFGGRSALHPVPDARQPDRKEKHAVCPNGQRVFECPASICENERCIAHPRAKCRIDNCGGCRPQWTVGGIYIIEDCNSTECPFNTLRMVCNDDPCKYSTCLKYADQNAVCRPSRCGGCKAEWFVNGKEVDCDIKTGIDRPCPDGSPANATCPIGTCSFRICPLNSTVRCIVNHCGCYPEFRDMNNNEAECDYYLWNPRRKSKKPTSSPESLAARHASRESSVTRTDIIDIPLDRSGPHSVVPVTRPIVSQGGATPLDASSLRESAQRGLQAALGASFGKEISGQPLHSSPEQTRRGGFGDVTNNRIPTPHNVGMQISTDSLQESAQRGLENVLGVSKEKGKQNEKVNVINDPLISDIPPPPITSHMDNFGGPSHDTFDQISAMPKPRTDIKDNNRFGGPSSSADNFNAPVFDNTPSLFDRKTPVDTSNPSHDSSARSQFGRQDVGNTNPSTIGSNSDVMGRDVLRNRKTGRRTSGRRRGSGNKNTAGRERFGNQNKGNTADRSTFESQPNILDHRPIVDGSVDVTGKTAHADFPQVVDNANPRSVGHMTDTERSRWNQSPKQILPEKAPIANKLSKKAPPKTIEEKKLPPPKNRKPLQRRGDMRVDKKPLNLPDGPVIQDIPLDISSNQNDPSIIDMGMSGQSTDPGFNVPSQNEAPTNMVILFNDNLGSQNVQPSLIDWLLSGLLSGADMTGVPIQSADQQPT